LFDSGIRRINISLDSLDKNKFKRITRIGDFDKVIQGIMAAKKGGLKIKINTVALKGINDNEILDLVHWCGENKFALTFIEVMPMGEMGEKRADQYMPLTDVRNLIQTKYSLTDDPLRTGGPARYVHCHETDQKIGFITPHTHNFCEMCNRVRITCTGEMYMCLGQQDKADLKTPLRKSENNQLLKNAIYEAISRKPKGHDFVIERRQDEKFVPRHMNVTGG
jgi:cyclic pyranopterin phosphate synthase